MFERGIVRPEIEREFDNRFDRAKSFWSKKHLEGKVNDPVFFEQVFESPESEIYKERCDDNFFFHVAKVLGGVEKKLPASSTTSSTTSTGEATTSNTRR